MSALKKLMGESGNNERIVPVECDISLESSVSAAVGKIESIVQHVDVLINNAGLLINKKFAELTANDWQAVYATNVFGVVNITRALLPLLMKGRLSEEGKQKSHVVNISSMGGVQGSQKFAGLSAYSSSKGALITMGECLAEEFASLGISVNTLALGSVQTEMFNDAFPGMKAASGSKDIALLIGEFALNGHRFFNGKVIPVSSSNP
jgi:NAD(P)-dependent dehydrogenase (short-subunit alcohol dehydrogenase family)